MSVVQLTPSPSNTLRQETTLPLQPIPASHPANHRANVVTGPEGKSGLPTPTIGRPSTPIPELPTENTFPEFPQPPATIPHTRGCPLQRYPNELELRRDVVIYGKDNRISCVSQKKAYDHGARLRRFGLFPKTRCTVTKKDDMKMVEEYIDAVREEEIWESTRVCGQTEMPRRPRYEVPFTLRESLFSTNFAKAVNSAYIALGGGPCYRVPSIYLLPEFADFDLSHLSAFICEVAEVGDFRSLCNIHHFRALPEHISYEEQLEEAAAKAEAEAKAKAEAEAEAAGAPETGEWDGEIDETETF